VRQILEVLPGALLPDPVAESDAPGAPLSPPDDDDLLRPAIEEELFRVGARGSLVGASTTALAKHLVWTFGPVHRALPFPLQVRVELDGDRLVTVDPEVGFLHQGLEKAAERLPWQDGFEVLARVCPLSPLGHELAWALVVERLYGVDEQVPKRAQLWRVVALELLRMAEHLRILSTPPLSPATERARRSLAEAARQVRGLLDGLLATEPFRAFGGLAVPIHDDEAARIQRELPRIAAAIKDVAADVDDNPALDAHLEGLGRITRFEALGLGLTGPALRACGVADDLRVHEPAFAYDEVQPVAVAVDGGDARARAHVRLREAAASADLTALALGKLSSASSETKLALPEAPPAGTAIASLELPSGELALLAVSDGGDKPVRVRMRGPSSALAAALPEILVGDRIDDVIPVITGLGLVGTEIDR
jgi:NADH:ubiquinone oxidoreductase subunit D